MKRIIRYMQDQALNQSASKIYLSPGGKEPQQRGPHSPSHSQYNAQQYSKQHSSALHRSTTPSAAAHSFPTHNSGCQPNPIPRCVTRHQYASDNILQSYEIYIPDDSSTQLHNEDQPPTSSLSSDEKIWIVYIHGGYFRDPLVTSSSFQPALSLLATSPLYARTRQHITGYASLNYRLAPHERYQQDKDKTPCYEFRNAKWPDMLEDIEAGIRHLKSKFGTGEGQAFRYILAGHSVGATLALLTTLKAGGSSDIPKPLGVIGLCGIYDFPALHTTYPDYEAITRNAIQNSDDVKGASPALHTRDEYIRHCAHEDLQKVVVLAHSKTDSLVDWSQVERMQSVFDDESSEKKAISCETIEIKGKHNEIWERGEELAKAIALTVRKVTQVHQDQGRHVQGNSPDQREMAHEHGQVNRCGLERSLTGATLVHRR